MCTTHTHNIVSECAELSHAALANFLNETAFFYHIQLNLIVFISVFIGIYIRIGFEWNICNDEAGAVFRTMYDDIVELGRFQFHGAIKVLSRLF